MTPAVATISTPGGASSVLEVEIERKYDVAPDFVLPPLDGRLAPVEEGSPAVRSQLSATYFDTDDARLMRFSIALRSRGTDSDSGWQLKVPSYPYRAELQWPPAPDTSPRAADELPSELTRLLRPFLRDAALLRAVRLDVSRTSYPVSNAQGQVVAELADDEVHATGLTAAIRAPRWREIEVELTTDGQPTDLDDIEQLLLAGGAYVSTSHAKLSRARLGIGNEGLGEARASAGAVLLDYIGRQSLEIIGGHFALMSDPSTSVHDVRSAVRRIRSSLRTFTDCFDQEAASDFGDQLEWYATGLAGVRDAEVMLELVSQPGSDFVSAEPALVRRLADDLARQRGALEQEMLSERYAELLESLLRWRESPPFTAAAGRPAKTLRASVRRAQKHLARQLFTAAQPEGSDADLHRTHRATRRVGDAEEATSALGHGSGPGHRDSRAGQSGGTDGVRATRNLLGEFRDHMLAAEGLRRLAEIASAEAENTFSYGVRAAQHLTHAEALRRQLRRDFGGG